VLAILQAPAHLKEIAAVLFLGLAILALLAAAALQQLVLMVAVAQPLKLVVMVVREQPQA
jgi:uncharacterized membrane protein YraQ (UPF0718 family)